MRDFFLTNTLSHEKELFRPVHPGHVGMYVCGPTVYGEAHLGHARPGVTYDVLFRLLRHLGYRVRYVRNITDVGHLEHDADEGEDKIAKKAKLEDLEPMEVVQTYTERYHEAMRKLNVVPPSIEPRASGHIIEQIEAVKQILAAGYAYESNGSVYFDVEKYDRDYHYGILSGRTLEGTLEGTRSLDGQSDKKAPYDFALWKKAEPEHIMRWPSPWGEGFPGWHLECSVMGEKYLGEEFDIHGGGMDLMFPHHECEIAQNQALRGTSGVRYWVHNNMITIGGQKMGKSLGNFITLPELFAGTHPKLEAAYSPMTIRFFILQAHYRSRTARNTASSATPSRRSRARRCRSSRPSMTPSATTSTRPSPSPTSSRRSSGSTAPRTARRRSPGRNSTRSSACSTTSSSASSASATRRQAAAPRRRKRPWKASWSWFWRTAARPGPKRTGRKATASGTSSPRSASRSRTRRTAPPGTSDKP